MNAQLDPTAQSLLNLSNNAPRAARNPDLTQFNTTLGPPLSFITPAQSVCNYASILFSNAASLASYNDGVANGQRFIVLQPPLAEGSADSAQLRAGQRPGRAAHQLPPLQPLSEHRLAGPDARVRGGQRGLSRPGSPIGNVPGNQGIHTSGQILQQIAKQGKPKKKKGKK